MKVRWIEMLVDRLLGCILLFVGSLLFSGTFFPSVTELLKVFGICFVMLVLAESVLRFGDLTHDPGFSDSSSWEEIS